jgi:murein DD-endopeptidase MepM/ murein hydrolase activator NlpD
MMIQRLKKTLLTIKKWIDKERTGRFSQSSAFTLLTRPLWHNDRTRSLVGAPLMAAMIAGASMSALPTTDTLQGWDISQPVSQIAGYTTEIHTDHTYFLPVADLTGISQGFHSGHPGLDLRAPLGSDVIAIDTGVVTDIIDQKYGYGRHVYIRHTDGVVALYAHLGLIMVEVGETVEANTKVGEIGLTGWSTGPHLHFEVVQAETKLNPMALLSQALDRYVAGK